MVDYLNVSTVNLSYGIHGFCRLNEDGGYSIVVNAMDSFERRMEAYYHELKHIAGDDFHSNDSVQTIESLAHI